MTQNFTKEFANIYFTDHAKENSITLTHSVEGTTLVVTLIKRTDSTGKKEYTFTLKDNGVCLYENSNKKNKGSSFDELFDALYKNPKYIEATRKVINSDGFDISPFEQDFSKLVDENALDVQSVFEEKDTLSKDELKNYLLKALEDKSVQAKLIELKEISDYLIDIESKKDTITEIPEELYSLALQKKGQVSKLEKVLINKAKKLVVACHLNNIHLCSDYIKEFEIRCFDYNLYKERSPSKYAITEEQKKVPKAKNLLQYIEVTINDSRVPFSNVGHSGMWQFDEYLGSYSYVTFNEGRLETSLGWDFQGIVNFVAGKVKESIYFFRPDKQEDNVKLDTYIYSVIKNALVSLKNYTSKVDSDGGISRWKDSLIIKKLKEVKYIFEEKLGQTGDLKWEFNTDNVVRELESYNETIKDAGAKISRKEVEEFIHKLSTSKLSLDEFMEGDEGGESTNQGLLNDLWSEGGQGSNFDPKATFESNERHEKITTKMNNIFGTSTQEQLVYELILEQISQVGVSYTGKRALKIDLPTVNAELVRLGLDTLTQTELEQITSNIYNKIIQERDFFKRLTSSGEDEFTKTIETDVDLSQDFTGL